jgi:hypothetical protein
MITLTYRQGNGEVGSDEECEKLIKPFVKGFHLGLVL